MSSKQDKIEKIISTFENKGLDILYAKYPNYPDPVKIVNHEPDVIGWDSTKEKYHIGMVADSEYIKSKQMQEKMEEFSGMMMKKGTSEGDRLPFHIGIPKNTVSTFYKKLDESKLSSQGNVSVEVI